MALQKQQSARYIAAALLDKFNPKKETLKDVLPKYASQTDQRNILMDVVFGIVRNRFLIDNIIERVSGATIKRIQKRMVNLVRIGVFELVFTPDRADYAIVDGVVEEAKGIAGIKAAGFVNALLRNIQRNTKNRSANLDTAEISKTVIREDGSGCEFNIDIADNPNTNPVKYLSEIFSLPEWLVKQWVQEFGFEKTRNVCIASNRRPSVYLRPNPLKITGQKFYEALRNEKIECQMINEKGSIKIEHAGDVSQLPGFDEGLFTIQDLTASEAVKILSPQPGWTVLDLCAAPGGKTTQIAELMGDKGIVFATDLDSKRLKSVDENCKRLGINSIKTFAYEKTADILKNVRCDAVLLDVPCSNTGVLARRPEVRYRIRPQSITELVKIQLDLLNRAKDFLKSGGKICYSTCSIQRQENFEVVQEFIAQNKSFSLAQECLTLPLSNDIDHDGGYAAILNKN